MGKVKIIVALDRNNLMGNSRTNDLPWPRIIEDMKYFEQTTTKNVVIMGRKTYESIPEKYRPLRNRQNIVVTRNPEDIAVKEPGVLYVSDMETAIQLYRDDNFHDIYIAGGSQIYSYVLQHKSIYVDELLITKIHKTYEGDLYFPEIDTNIWQLHSELPIQQTKSGIEIQFLRYIRK